jgi:carbonic anhydrase
MPSRKSEGPSSCSRRRFLSAAAATAVAGYAFKLPGGTPARAEAPLTPESALRQLLDGNARYVSQRPRSQSPDFAAMRAKTETKQEPFACVLACSDSRVPVEIIFDQAIGQLFVARVAGNIAAPEVIASLEYGTAELGTPLIMVLGHSHCGAVKAAVAGEQVPGQISALFAPIQPAVDEAGHDVEAAVKANARIQAATLRKSSPVLAALTREGKLKVVAATYQLDSGKVDILA